MRGLNRVMIIGNCGSDPDVKYTQSGKAVANLSVATSESWTDAAGVKQERTEWHRVTAWEKLAEIIQQYVKKGSRIYIEGKLQTDKYDKDGQTHYSTKIIAQQMLMLDSRPQGEAQEPAAAPTGESGDGLPF